MNKDMTQKRINMHAADAKGQVCDILKKVKIVKFWGRCNYSLQDFACYSEFYPYLCTQYN